MVIMVIVIYLLIIFFEYVPLYRKKLWPEFWTNAVLGVFSFAVAILISLKVQIPSPEKPIREFITSIFGK